MREGGQYSLSQSLYEYHTVRWGGGRDEYSSSHSLYKYHTMCAWNDYRVVVKSITFATTNRITIPRQSIAQSQLMTSLVAVDGSGLSRCSFTDKSASLRQDDHSVTGLHHIFGWSQKTVETATVLTILASSFNNNKERERESLVYMPFQY